MCYAAAFRSETETPVNAPVVGPGLVPAHIPRPQYVLAGRVTPPPKHPPCLDADLIARMRIAGRKARAVLEAVLAAVAPGVTTDDLDRVAMATCSALGVYPSPLGFHGYPRSICTSVNEVICHGIPGGRRLKAGDIINCDITVHGDCSETVFVGSPDAESRRLVNATYEAMWAGIRTVRPGQRLDAIGRAITAVARRERMGNVLAFAGHGIGEWFHMPPDVSHGIDRHATLRLQAGMVFTIEPMFTLGDPRCVMLDDGWTAVTRDGRRSAQFEHTVLVTPTGFEVLTAGEPWFRRPATPSGG